MSTNDSANSQVKRLARIADDLQSKLLEMKRPLVIEFAGTPKAGKTTCVDAISKFFRRNKIPSYVVTERASVCPVKNKTHMFFNTWTGTTSLAQLIEALESRSNIIMLDRGIFDTLVWMNFLNTMHSVRPDELRIIEDFFLLEPWTSRIDIVVALSVEPNTAMKREFFNQITDTPGSIMNNSNLSGYNTSLHQALEKYKDKYHILHIDTTDKGPVEGVTHITESLLDAALRLVDEEIAVIDRNYLAQFNFKNNILSRGDDISNFMESVKENLKWAKRKDAENDLSVVQLIPTTTLLRDNEILVMNIRGEKQGRLEDHYAVWAGGHIRISDQEKAERFFQGNIAHSCISRELDEEISIRIRPNDLGRLPRIIVWDTTNPKSAQHLGLIFEYRMSKKTPKEVLHLREFYEMKSKSLFTHFRKIDDNLNRITNWESWSTHYLKYVYKINISIGTQQGRMF